MAYHLALDEGPIPSRARVRSNTAVFLPTFPARGVIGIEKAATGVLRIRGTLRVSLAYN